MNNLLGDPMMIPYTTGLELSKLGNNYSGSVFHIFNAF